MLSSHYQGTPYDPYGAYGDKSEKGAFRSIGINRNDFLSVIQMRPDQPADSGILEWVAFASNAFNTLVPFYAEVTTTPDYLSNTTAEVSTDNFYWASRMIAAMADASYKKSANERVAEMLKKESAATLNQVLYELSNLMKNSYSRSDA